MSLILTRDNIIVGEDVEFAIDGGLGELQILLMRAHDNKILQIDAETGEELTAGLVLNRAITLAKWLQSMGIKPGDAVTINSENRLEFVIVPFALFFIGAVFAPLNPEYTPSELAHVLNLTKPKVAFCSRSTLETMKKILPNHPYMQKLVLFGKHRVSDNGVCIYEDIIKGVVDDPIYDYEPISINPKESVATIMCSSGTTGLPKGVMTTHANITTFIDIARVRVQEMIEADHAELTTLGLTPFFHSMGFMSMYLNMLGGNLVVVIKKFKTKLFLESVQKYKVTTLIVPPPVILLLTKHPLVSKYDLSSLRDVRSGAAPMGKDMEEEVRRRYKLFHVSQGYGMTETTLGVLVSKYNHTKLGSVGQIVPGMMAKVIDDSGKNLGPHQEGEVCFKGPLVMKGYIRDPIATNSTIDEDGWLHTGDVAYYDNEGFFFIVDRLKELIKYKAFQVAPAELEALLQTHPSVADAAVVGMPDPEAGELPVAYVVKKVGVETTAKELQNFVAGKVSRQKKLRGGVYFIDEIPRNPSGKILRRKLKQRAIAIKSKL